MKNRILTLDFTGTGLSKNRGITRICLDQLEGTDGYCSEEAAAVLRKIIAGAGYEGIHFLDSGNYHYLTKFFLELIRQPYDLVVFDHHTDMQPPALLPLLSCGSWLLETMEQEQAPVRAWLIGPPAGAEALIREEWKHKIRWITEEDLAALGERLSLPEKWPRPVYFSIDKDVLRRQDARTNWDQGQMTLEDLCGFIEKIGSRTEILGADICGSESVETAEGRAVNSRTDQRLVECLDKILKPRR